MNSPPLHIVHFVTGGGTGATRVALDLALAQSRAGAARPHLILRNKGRALPAVMQQQAEAAGLPLYWVDNVWPRARVIRQLRGLCAQIHPTVFFAHGYSEHLWGREAALAEQIPVVVHVEHNVERYLPWRVWHARRLAPATAATACVSSAVEQNVRRLNMGGRRVVTVHNGVDLQRFHCQTPLHERRPDILMPARFARKKDQPTLIRAARLLVDRGWQGDLLLAGGGKPVHRRHCERLVRRLGLQDRVKFLGNVNDLPQRLAQCRIAALASWQEGLPLVLAEAMAAGCAVVASAIPGITDILRDEPGHANGWLFPPGDAQAAADALWLALQDPEEAQRRADAGRRDANGHFSLDEMAARYDTLLQQVLADVRVANPSVDRALIP
jgi:glycosyltransferase involved in cell wall biosynthesis